MDIMDLQVSKLIKDFKGESFTVTLGMEPDGSGPETTIEGLSKEDNYTASCQLHAIIATCVAHELGMNIPYGKDPSLVLATRVYNILQVIIELGNFSIDSTVLSPLKGLPRSKTGLNGVMPQKDLP